MITVRNLCKTFDKLLAVDGVSFEVAPGETFALLGPNGSGKTTTLKCIAGLHPPSGGQILIDGKDAATQSKQVRAAFSYLPQRVSFPETLEAREILKFYCRLRKLPLKRVDEIVDQFRLGEVAGRAVQEFSGGMMQRLGIAIACLPEAPVLILDEPTVSLDPRTALDFREFLLEQKRKHRTILFSSHVLADVEQLADRFAILVEGKLVGIESVEAMRNGLAIRSAVHVVIRCPQERFVEAALKAGAETARFAGDTLRLECQPGRRWSILLALQSAGAQIEGFSTEEPTLEQIYLRYIREKRTPHSDGSFFRELSGQPVRASGY